jgi:hypothetical protein
MLRMRVLRSACRAGARSSLVAPTQRDMPVEQQRRKRGVQLAGSNGGGLPYVVMYTRPPVERLWVVAEQKCRTSQPSTSPQQKVPVRWWRLLLDQHCELETASVSVLQDGEEEGRSRGATSRGATSRSAAARGSTSR